VASATDARVKILVPAVPEKVSVPSRPGAVSGKVAGPPPINPLTATSAGTAVTLACQVPVPVARGSTITWSVPASGSVTAST
jgi:hypothetical protein